MQKGIVINLLDKEIRDVGARDEAATPVAWIDQRAIGVCLRPIGQDHGTHDHPVELAIADNSFLRVLVVIDAPQQTKRHVIKKPTAAAAVGNRLTRAFSIAVTSTRVALEKNRVGL